MDKRIICLVLLAALLSGCKLIIKVPAGGSVETKSGDYSCDSEETCEIFVVDILFDEIFMAVPDGRRVFIGWERADRHFCGGSRKDCPLTTETFEGNELLMSFLANQDEEFYLVPVFADPDSEEFIQVRLSGTWDYVQTWGDCSATGQIEQFVESDRGVYQTYTGDSVRVTSVDPCETVIAGQLLQRTVGPIITIDSQPLSVYEIEDAFRANKSLEVSVEVVSANEYRVIIIRSGEPETFTYTRVENRPGVEF